MFVWRDGERGQRERERERMRCSRYDSEKFITNKSNSLCLVCIIRSSIHMTWICRERLQLQMKLLDCIRVFIICTGKNSLGAVNFNEFDVPLVCLRKMNKWEFNWELWLCDYSVPFPEVMWKVHENIITRDLKLLK